MNCFQVSAIVCTYNFNQSKMIRTLKSLINQVEVSYEIIITDDGTKEADFKFATEFFVREKFSNYKIIKNEENEGTVRNLLRGIEEATGEYVFSTSPGDLLHDNYVFRDFYEFAKNNEAKVIFGDGIYYNFENEVNLYCVENSPNVPWFFLKDNKKIYGDLSIMLGKMILGASFFRERKIFYEALKNVLPKVKYIEDDSTSVWFVLKNYRIIYYERPVVFYEYKSGISTCGDENWTNIILSEINSARIFLGEKYKKNPMVAYSSLRNRAKERKSIIFLLPLLHPKLFLVDIIIHLKPSKYTDVSLEEKKRLEQLIL